MQGNGEGLEKLAKMVEIRRMLDPVKSYRVDYTAEGASRETVIYGLSRADAMRRAATESRKHGSAYAIATENGKDTGQRVYYGGRYSHQDDVF